MGSMLLELAALAIVGAISAWRRARAHGRQRRLLLLAERAGLRFSPVDLDGIAAWVPFRWLIRGTWMGHENVLAYRDEQVAVFDLLVEDRTGAWTAVHEVRPVPRRLTCAVVPIAVGCPKMVIRPEHPIDGLAEVVTGEAIDLDLEAFNRRFTVRCDDRRFAVAFCDQRMMRAILRLPPRVGLATNEDRLLLFGPMLHPHAMALLLEVARSIGAAVPPVLTDLYPPRPEKSPYEDRWLQGRWSPDPTGRP